MSETPSTDESQSIQQNPQSDRISPKFQLNQKPVDQKVIEQTFQSFKQDVQSLQTKNIQMKQLKADVQLDRLINQRFQNPYDVLLLDMEATDEEIKKQHRNFAIILHPDRCKDERSKDAFFIVDKAYKTLMDPEKRKIYMRIMREAKERTEYERQKENKKRAKSGLPDLPEDTFEGHYRENLKKIFDEIEERKVHHAKLQMSQQMAKNEEIEKKKMIEQYRIYTEEEWEQTRESRVSNWRTFSKKKAIIGSKKSDKSLKPPPTKMEERPLSAVKQDNISGKPIGINEDYKKNWR